MKSRARMRDAVSNEAVEKYVEFHRYEPKEIGEFPASFKIPDRMYLAGKAIWEAYRSSKVDPETLRKPRKPVDYIHENDAGVMTYLAEPFEDGDELVDVPVQFRSSVALVRLGQCLGYCHEDADGEPAEASSTRPLPDLYTTPCGRCLLVIQDRKHVIAMIWGGGLGVFARGIDG
jgi:hypothetical protein